MTAAVSQRYTTLSYRTVGSGDEIITETYKSGKHLQLALHGFRFTNPKTGVTCPASELFNEHVDPSVVYIARVGNLVMAVLF